MHPVAFSFGGFEIHWYGILAAAGFLAGFHLASRRGRSKGLDSQVVMSLGPWMLVGALLGARSWYLYNEEIGLDKWPEWFQLREGGLVWYGGFIGAGLATVIYSRIRGVPLWPLADALAPSIPLGHALGRIGCLMTGCCWGTPCELPWAIRLPAHPDPVHPVQVYEALLNFCLYGLLAWLHRKSLPHGSILAIYLMGYAVLRAVTEVFRGDGAETGIISQAQWVSLTIFLTGSILCLWKCKRSVVLWWVVVRGWSGRLAGTCKAMMKRGW